jgi:RNA recognition motif-containing protein
MTEEQALHGQTPEGDMIISTTKLFVGGLDRDIRGRQLNDEFSKFGVVKFARVKLREDGKSKGFGFVEFERPEDAAKAQAEMNDKELNGRVIKVDFARESLERIKAREERAAAMAAEAPAEAA